LAQRKRHDPPSTPADGSRNYDRLVGRDPDRHYVFANPNDETCGVEAYLAKGYEIEQLRPGGPRVPGKRTSEGAEVTSLNQVLVSCPSEDRAAEERTWAAQADGFDKRVLKDGNIDDPLRGKTRNGMRVGVDPRETEWAQPEGA